MEATTRMLPYVQEEGFLPESNGVLEAASSSTPITSAHFFFHSLDLVILVFLAWRMIFHNTF